MNDLIKTLSDVKISLTIDDLFERINDRWRWFYCYADYTKFNSVNFNQPSIEVIQENSFDKIIDEFFSKDGYVISDKVITFYKNGYTIILSRCEYLFSEIITLTDEIKKFRQINSANIYFGKGTKSISFVPHTHYYDVIVKNVCGKSIWNIGGKEILVKSQDVIFIPKNTSHCVVSIQEPKFSITFNLIDNL